MKPLSKTIEEFNKDRQPLEQLDMDHVKASVAKRPPPRAPSNNSQGVEIVVKRDTRNGRIPFRLADSGHKVIEAVRLGATYTLAAQYAGVQVTTLYNWISKAEKLLLRVEQEEDPMVEESEIIYLDFLIRLQEAEGKAVVGWLKAINDAAIKEGKWQAAAWLLERRHAAAYGKRTEVHQHHSKGNATLEEWQQTAKKRRLEAKSVIAEIEEIEDVDFRALGKPQPSGASDGN